MRKGSKRIKARKKSKVPFLFLLLPMLVLPSCGPDRADSPNLVLIVFDALRPDHTGSYGYGRPTTPNLDGLAADSVLFRNALAPAAFTLPSMATLFTSLGPLDHGVRRHLDPEGLEDRLEEKFLTLAETLKERGYATGAVVSNSLFMLEVGFDQGFDYYNPGKRRDAEPTTDAALAWLKGLPDDAPFFLWVHYIDPHWPYDAPRDFRRPFSHPDKGQFQRTVLDFEGGRLSSDRIYFESRLDEDGLCRGIAEYDNEIAYADHHMGRVVDYLKERGIYDETLIAVVSDHGESLGEHDLTFAHSFYLYDTVQKVVWLLKPPGRKEAAEVERQVRLLDFMPTVLSCLGIDDRAGMKGRNLRPSWEGSAEFPDLPAYAESEPRYRNRRGSFRYPARRRVYLEGNEGKWRMIRHEGYKLILIPGEGKELYDLDRDPDELKSVLEERPAIAEKLTRMLEAVLEKDRSGPSAGGREPLAGDGEAVRLIKEMGY